jgi:hypothetical protein
LHHRRCEMPGGPCPRRVEYVSSVPTPATMPTIAARRAASAKSRNPSVVSWSGVRCGGIEKLGLCGAGMPSFVPAGTVHNCEPILYAGHFRRGRSGIGTLNFAENREAAPHGM